MSSKSKKAEARSEALRKDVDFTEHTWDLPKLYEHFGCTYEKGLTSAGVLENRAKYGPNSLTPPPSTPEWLKFVMQFANFFSMLLLGGGILCFIGYALDQTDPTNLYLGVVLVVVVFITSTFSYFQESKSDKIMEGFKNMIPKKCKVIRDGGMQVIDAVDIVPGDIVDLNDGDQVPADIRVLTSNEMKVDNSSLTGESEPQDRVPELAIDSNGQPITQPLEATNLCFYTTIVNSGTARGCVIGTGDRTVMGQIAGLATETSTEDSPIAREIKKFIMLISVVAITLGVVFFIIGVVIGTPIIKNVVFAIGIIVANVPEGLLATVTVSLALTAKRMHQKNVLVKNLEAVETLGSTTVIASDKTGTLTQNRMTVQHCWYDDKVCCTPAAKNLPDLERLLKMDTGMEPWFDRSDETFKKLQMVGTLCNNSDFLTADAEDESKNIDLDVEMKKPDFNLLALDCTSDASEAGLAKCMHPLRSVREFRAQNPKIFEIKFNSTNKWQLSIHKSEGGGAPLLVMKGAPERVLKMCKFIMINGEKIPIDAEWEKKYTDAYEGLGGLGERVLGFAYKDMDGYSDDFKFAQKPSINFKNDDLTFVGLFSLIDPPREGVPEAVDKCKRARIKVFMVTGDHPITAQAIAKQVGIIDQDKWDQDKATVVKGDDIREWMEITNKEEQVKKWDNALRHEQIVWARVSPAHKLLIVENAQRRGEIVAVTGDGVNDAPALKKGDIGVAMGIAGKDVSKEAADMILMDDNFASIVNGVEEGRLIFDNLKKSIAYTLTSNIPEIGPFLTFIVIQLPLPLSTVLILCVDLGTDMVPAISLAYETKESDIMDRPPRNSATDRLVNRRLISFAYGQIGMMQALAGFYTYMVVLNDFGYPPHILMGNGLDWDTSSLMCTVRESGQPDKCGYGCEDPNQDFDPLYDFVEDDEKWCQGGCKIPEVGAMDPFVEFTPQGFRGFNRELWGDGDKLPFRRWNGEEKDTGRPYEVAVCGRSCQWWDTMDLAARADANKFTPAEVAAFNSYCSTPGTLQDLVLDRDTNVAYTAAYFGFPGRNKLSSSHTADAGAFYWWGGKAQRYPNVNFQANALAFAQTSYFISIIVVQWADLMISKCRKLSLFDQGMTNSFMNFGLCFETILGALLIYIPPLNNVFGTRPLFALHWCPGIPWSILIFTYDETRKFLMRANPGGFLEEYTYW